MANKQPRFRTFHQSFGTFVDEDSKIELCAQNEEYPWAHEACVYIHSRRILFVTSNICTDRHGDKRIQISKVDMNTEPFTVQEIHADLPMANGGVNFLGGILFCCQGTLDRLSALVLMDAQAPYECTELLQTYHGREFNSPNDVVVDRDGSIWFTDPIYGFEQGFRPPPKLPNQVYRFDPATHSVRVVADGFGRPNGIAFSPDHDTLYITDTDFIHGDGTTDLTRASTM